MEHAVSDVCQSRGQNNFRQGRAIIKGITAYGRDTIGDRDTNQTFAILERGVSDTCHTGGNDDFLHIRTTVKGVLSNTRHSNSLIYRRNNDLVIGTGPDPADRIRTVIVHRVAQPLGIQCRNGFVQGLAARGTGAVLTALHAEFGLLIDHPIGDLMTGCRSKLSITSRAILRLGTGRIRAGGMGMAGRGQRYNLIATGTRIPVYPLVDTVPLFPTAGIINISQAVVTKKCFRTNR